MEEEAAASTLPVAEVSAVGRIPGALFSPGKTFESIARRPTWLLPLLLWIVVSLVVTNLVLPKVDYDRLIRASIEKRGQSVSEERIQNAVESQKKIAPVLYNAFATVSPALVSLLVAVIFWGSFKAFGWDSSFRQAFGVTTHSFLPGILASILLIPVISSREAVDPRGLGDLLRSNLGFLVERDSSKVLHSLLQSLDIFSIWSLFLLVLGFAVAAKVSRKKSAAVIVTLWLLYVLGKAGVSALFG